MTLPPQRILIVDDEPPIRKLLRTGLAAHGFSVLEAEDGKNALAMLRRNAMDLVILDLGLPEMDGFGVIEALRQSGASIPIVVLSARSDETGKVRALDMGADDFVTKPVGMEELLARIRAALRHRLQREGEQPLFHAGDLSVDLVRRIVRRGETEVKLTPREYEMLRLFIAHAGKVLTHKFILEKIWGASADVKSLRIYIRTLRQKLEAQPEQPSLILTEQGVGYRLRSADI